MAKRQTMSDLAVLLAIGGCAFAAGAVFDPEVWWRQGIAVLAIFAACGFVAEAAGRMKGQPT